MPLTLSGVSDAIERDGQLAFNGLVLHRLYAAGLHPLDKLPLETLIPADVRNDFLGPPFGLLTSRCSAPKFGVSYGTSAKSMIFLPEPSSEWSYSASANSDIV
ncbi:hypothetical protein HFN80_35430 [Rhizobium laguerreae]|uniref:hypothetical protein n=1 Tax=Rhizobium laguerreae TaxID=1076926 RepID=UPI001C9259BB|nr:hypothetical protein [Rhizobium laguerreae]MBY3469200.1 hypothetical protein [Rhizobium laguerreae]